MYNLQDASDLSSRLELAPEPMPPVLQLDNAANTIPHAQKRKTHPQAYLCLHSCIFSN